MKTGPLKLDYEQQNFGFINWVDKPGKLATEKRLKASALRKSEAVSLSATDLG